MTKIGKATIANNLLINGDFILEFDFKIVIIPVIIRYKETRRAV